MFILRGICLWKNRRFTNNGVQTIAKIMNTRGHIRVHELPRDRSRYTSFIIDLYHHKTIFLKKIADIFKMSSASLHRYKIGLNGWNHENWKCKFLELIRPETRQPLVLDFFIFGKRILIATNPQWRSHSIINNVIQDLFKVIHNLRYSSFKQTCKSQFW